MNLPGILGLTLFGQPLWGAVADNGNRAVNLNCYARIVRKGANSDVRATSIIGRAMIVRYPI